MISCKTWLKWLITTNRQSIDACKWFTLQKYVQVRRCKGLLITASVSLVTIGNKTLCGLTPAYFPHITS